MRVLFFSFYYPPDLSAGSFRADALTRAILARLGPSDTVRLVTTTPNRYAQMEVADAAVTPDPRLTVTRVAVPAHQSGIGDQVRSFAAFARGAFAAAKDERPDLVIATSSRLFTAMLGALLARRCGAPLYLDIRDIFSETIENVFANSPVRLAMPLIRALERWTLRSAQQINVVSPAFVEYFAPIVDGAPISVHTNGVDEQFVDFVRSHPLFDKPPARPRVVAAGNIGEGQGLHHIVPGLAAAFPKVDFRIIGGGGRRAQLERAVAEAEVDNVVILDPVARERLNQEYAQASVLFMHLNDLAGFDRVIPSKMFEYAATGRPILAGVRGRSDVMLAEVAGAERFAPCDLIGASAALAKLLAGPRLFDRSAFVARYDRRTIMGEMAKEILAVASGRGAVAPTASGEGLPNDP